MTATQVQAQLLEEIETLTMTQRLLLLDLIRSFRGAFQEAADRLETLGPLKLHLSQASSDASFRREDIYGDDGR